MPDRPLTKGEASDLIEQLTEDPERQAARDENQMARLEQEFKERERNLAFHLHTAYAGAKQEAESAKRGEVRDAKMYLRDAQNERLNFWQDTFRLPQPVNYLHGPKVESIPLMPGYSRWPTRPKSAQTRRGR